jgi:hypothetical protein
MMIRFLFYFGAGCRFDVSLKSDAGIADGHGIDVNGLQLPAADAGHDCRCGQQDQNYGDPFFHHFFPER